MICETVVQDTQVETIHHEGKTIAHVVRKARSARQTEFITDSQDKQQVGFIVYPRGGVIPRHVHRPYIRQVVGMSEVLLVREGRMEADFYGEDKQLVGSRILEQGDLLVLVSGGHGFRCIENTVLLEIKQGPYIGPDEKERF